MDIITSYIRQLDKYELLTPEEERALAKDGTKEALDKLIKSNLRLVVYFAQKYNYSNGMFQEFIQEGNIGLLKAARKFDPDKNVKFSTYAALWIKKYILNCIATKKQVVEITQDFSKKNLEQSKVYINTDQVEMKLSLEKLLKDARISKRDRQIFTKRFLLSTPCQTLAKEYKVSHQRISQIEHDVFANLLELYNV